MSTPPPLLGRPGFTLFAGGIGLGLLNILATLVGREVPLWRIGLGGVLMVVGLAVLAYERTR